jgi:hypothetical protein
MSEVSASLFYLPPFVPIMLSVYRSSSIQPRIYSGLTMRISPTNNNQCGPNNHRISTSCRLTLGSQSISNSRSSSTPGMAPRLPVRTLPSHLTNPARPLLTTTEARRTRCPPRACLPRRWFRPLLRMAAVATSRPCAPRAASHRSRPGLNRSRRTQRYLPRSCSHRRGHRGR